VVSVVSFSLGKPAIASLNEGCNRMMNGLITAIAIGSEAHQDVLIADRQTRACFKISDDAEPGGKRSHAEGYMPFAPTIHVLR
jgi:hypothetical protein